MHIFAFDHLINFLLGFYPDLGGLLRLLWTQHILWIRIFIFDTSSAKMNTYLFFNLS